MAYSTCLSRSLALLLALAVGVALASIGVIAQTPTQTKYSLAFLRTLSYEFSVLNNSWTGSDYCSWSGVTCNSAGFFMLDLSYRGLVGTLAEYPTIFGPPNYIDATQVMVQSIDLSHNSGLSGSFPQAWGFLSRLLTLNMSYTSLSGTVPPNWTRMFGLETLVITHTHACESLPNFTTSSLRTIDLSNNYFTGSMAYAWGSMTRLTSVNLNGNHLCGCMPDSWSSVPALYNAAPAYSKVTANCNTSRPCDTTALSCSSGWSDSTAASDSGSSDTLKFLQSFSNAFSVLRSSWTGSDYCSWNGITCASNGEVSVDISSMALTGTMPSMSSSINGAHVTVVSIDMSSNSGVTGTFNSDWSTLTQLRELDLSTTSLKGDVPDEWNGMTALQSINIASTKAEHGLPDWNIASLRTIDFSNNYMTGSLSASWGNMTGLTSVNLRGNSFCGCVPSSWDSVSVLTNAASASSAALVASNCDVDNACSNSDSASVTSGTVPLLVGVCSAAVATIVALGL